MQGILWVCKRCCMCARDGAGVQGIVQVCMVLWVCMALRVCTVLGVCVGLCTCPVPGVACALWSPLWGPHKQTQGCVSGPGTPKALGMQLRGHPKILGSERPKNCEVSSKIPPVLESVGFLSNYSKLENSKCHKAVAYWDGAISSGTERMEGEDMGLRGCRAPAEPGYPAFHLPSRPFLLNFMSQRNP